MGSLACQIERMRLSRPLRNIRVLLLICTVFGLSFRNSKAVPDTQGFLHQLSGNHNLPGVELILSSSREQAMSGIELLQDSLKKRKDELTVEELISVIRCSFDNSIMEIQKDDLPSDEIVSEVKPELRERFTKLSTRLEELQERVIPTTVECFEYRTTLESEKHKYKAHYLLTETALVAVPLIVDAKTLITMSDMTSESLSEIEKHMSEAEGTLKALEEFLDVTLFDAPGSRSFKKRQRLRLGLGLGIGLGVPVLGIIGVAIFLARRRGSQKNNEAYIQMNSVMGSNYERV